MLQGDGFRGLFFGDMGCGVAGRRVAACIREGAGRRVAACVGERLRGDGLRFALRRGCGEMGCGGIWCDE